MKNIFKHWYVIFIAVCACGFSGLCWYRTFNHKSVQSENPSDVEDSKDTNDSLDDQIDNVESDWDDNIAEKSELSKIDQLYTYYTTKDISSTQVLIGKNDWLFYKTSTDGNTIDDYEGTNLFTDEQMQNVLNQALAIQDATTSKGIGFTIFVAPNKENIYSEYMPNDYTHAENSRTDILVQYLKDNGVQIVEPKAELLSLHSKYQLYYSYDTHWNQLGGYVGVTSILDAWNLESTSLKDRKITKSQLDYHYCGEDDLAQMLGMRENIFNDEIEYQVEGTLKFDWEAFKQDQDNGNITCFENPSAINDKTVFLIGDSYRSAMIPALMENFRYVYVVHRYSYITGMIDQVSPDYVIVEFVERYGHEMQNIGSIY